MSRLVFFTADDGIHGRELWVTDGTPAGTRMIDIAPGPQSSWPSNFAVLPDGRVVFQATDAPIEQHRSELFVSDGTDDGTYMVRNIGGIGFNGEPRFMTPLGDGRIVFSASDGRWAPDGDTGRELWITDGTAAGTALLKDINPNVEFGRPQNSDPRSFYALGNGKVVFFADDGEHGREPWVTDGTPEGTFMLRDLTPGPDSTIVFSGNTRLLDDGRLLINNAYVTDGTTAGTVPYDPEPEPDPVFPRQPDVFERGINQDAYPVERGISHVGLSETRTLFAANGAQKLSADRLPGLQLAESVPDGTTNLRFDLIAEQGTRIAMMISGSDGQRYEAISTHRSLLDPDSVPVGSLSVPLAGLGNGPVVISAIAQPVKVSNDESAIIKVTFSGSGGSVTQTTSPLGPGSRWITPSAETMRALGDGPISVSSVTGEIREFDGTVRPVTVRHELTDFHGVIPTGRELWATDGTEAGTRMIADILPGAIGSDIDGFVRFPDGRVLFHAVDGPAAEADAPAASLWITDGTASGTVKLSDAVGRIDGSPRFSKAVGTAEDKMVVLSRDGNTLWVTDGTPGGTERIAQDIARVDRPTELQDGRLLLGTTGSDAQSTKAIWVTDGTAEGSLLVTEGIELPFGWESHYFVEKDIIVVRYNDPVTGPEPWALDLANGGFTLLADINPGPDGSAPQEFILALPESQRVPNSTLFETRVTLLDDAADSFSLRPFFSDPMGGALSFFLQNLPAGVSFDPATAMLTAAADAAAGRHEVTVTADSTQGGRTTDSFAWDLVDTGLLKIEASGGWGRETRESPITLEPGGVLHVGLKEGNPRLIRIEGAEATIEEGKLTVSGQVFSGQLATDLPLMQGGFTIDMATLTVSDFEDERIEASHRLVGDLIEMGFSDIALRPDGIVLRTDLEFGDAFSVFSTQGGLLALHVDDAGLSFGLSELGTGRWFTDTPLALPLPEGAPFALEFSDLGMNYNALTDSIYLMGKAAFTWGETVAKQYSFLDDSTTSKLTIDLAGDQADGDLFAMGDKFLRIGKDAQGWNWDVVGEIAYEGKEGAKPLPGRPFIEEMRFSLDTVDQEVGGAFKGTMPTLFKGLTLEAEISASWDPLAIDGFAFGIDGLNAPLGTTGLFVQGGKLAAENLTAQDPDDWPELSAQITMTVGPNTALISSPVRGHLGGAIAGAEVTLDIEAGTKVEYLLPGAVERIAAPMIRWLGVDANDVLDFQLMQLTGEVSMDFARPSFSAGLGASFLDEMITGQANVSAQTLNEVTNLSASVSATATFPKALPLIGGLSRAGNGLAVFSSDGNNGNDFAAAWTSFSVPFYGSSSAGIRLWLDGRYEVLGRKAIDAIGSWELGPEQDLVILSAQWENASDAARLALIAPDGSVLSEADFGTGTGLAAGIALVDDLTSPLGRHVALQNPVAGIWDVRLVSEAGLGAVRYEASAMLEGPQATITGIDIAPGTRAGTIDIDLAPGDADEIALTLFVSETPDALSGFSVIEAVVPANDAGGLSFDWDFAALASGTWWLHARAEGEGMVPGVSMWATPIAVAGSADLAVTLDQQAAAGGASVLSVTVTNLGDIASGAGMLDLTVPEAALGGPALPGADPLTQMITGIALESLAPGESLRLDFALPAGLGVMVQPVMAEVSATVYDADLGNNTDVLFLAALGAGRAGSITTRGGAALAGAEVTASLPDGSSVSAFTGADGGFSLAGLPPGAGMVDASHAFAPAQAGITAGDALEVLRIAVGLQPAFGPAGPLDYIAADVNRDGQVTANDALEVLRHAVGLPSAHAPQWIFLDAGADLSTITAANTRYATGIDLTSYPLDTDLDMTAVLLGNMVEVL